ITDGQIFLESDLFYKGIRPAISVGKSVSRVGGAAQIKAMKQVAGSMKLELAQFRAMEAFAAFASDLDKATQQQLARGRRLVEVLKQGQYQPVKVEEQIVMIFAASNGFVDAYPESDVKKYEKEMIEFLKNKHPEILKTISEKKAISDDSKKALLAALGEFKAIFQPSNN
ncbi:MAG: F0F1 ATP synthase subunit alpha, partial [Bdellovibrio sp.]|nr:F0F1 ATP synthase subunit alpha [Bdellovibrio sp.]